MTYSSVRDKADVTPLSDAIERIRAIVATHSYTPEENDDRAADLQTLTDQLDQIDDLVRDAREAFLANVRAAQDAELQELRSKARDAG